ncbi:hypothetical protein JXB28_05865 [Candidatus Woesearchaeota archaeon]|nr:hypothetical protein [Candidatus Woesearchaeota archaeon]
MKKAQAALEFLTTYGWAFLVILVMIGALAYFGILSPSRFLPERCNVGPEFSCDEHQVLSAGTLNIIFTNNVGDTINSVTVTGAKWAQETLLDGDADGDIDNCVDISGNSYRAGDPITVTCTFNNALFPPEGAKMKFNVDLTYIPQGKTYTKPLTAEVYTALQP